MARLWALLLVLALAGGGCASRKADSEPDRRSNPVSSTGTSTGKGNSRKAAPGPIVTPANLLSGKIVKVNVDAKFVVLSFPLGKLPALEQRLAVYHQGMKAGELKVTGPQRDDKIVADLVAGQVAVGDEVRDQ